MGKKGQSDTSKNSVSYSKAVYGTMKVGKPKTGSMQGISGLPKIPAVRPTTMRNLTPWNGWVQPPKPRGE